MKNSITLKQILKNRWHLHSLTFILAICFLYIGNKYQIMQLHNVKFGGIDGTQWIFRLFISTFSSFWLAAFIEWCQGKFFGANKTAKEIIGSNKDILVSTIAGFIGGLIYVLILE